MYEVIGSLKSRTFRVIWMLEELGEPYRHIAKPPRSETVRAMNPSGKIPVLRDGDAILTDSAAILTYLADKHGALTYPAGTIDRARQDAFTHLLLDEVDSLLWTAARHSFILPEELRVPAVKATVKWEFEQNMNRLAEKIKGPFLMGETMTVPDILAAHCISWAITAKFPLEQQIIRDYFDRMKARPAYQRAAGKPAAKAS